MLAFNGDKVSRESLRKFSRAHAHEKGRSFIIFSLIIGTLDLQDEETINGLQFLSTRISIRRRWILQVLVFLLRFRPKALFRLALNLLGQEELLSGWGGTRAGESGY